LNRSLLVVDDDIDQVSAISRWLSRRGYHVVTANHSRQALVAASGRRFQAALVDASLPDIDGLDLMKRLKRLQHDLPVIILSGYDFSGHNVPENWSTTHSAFACLTKGCDLGLLEKTIEDAIDRTIDESPRQERFDGRPLSDVAIATK
jgi:DNA-binding NtrC family response regulator